MPCRTARAAAPGPLFRHPGDHPFGGCARSPDTGRFAGRRGNGPKQGGEGVSLRRRVLRVRGAGHGRRDGLRGVCRFCSAKKISKSQKASISKQLRKQIKKNPRAIRSKSFLRKAALVNFKLPVTIRLRGECPAGSGGAAMPVRHGWHAVNTGLNERGTATRQRRPRPVARSAQCEPAWFARR